MLKWVKPIRDNSVQIKYYPAQDRAGLPMEEHPPATQPLVKTPQRGILGAIKRLFRKNNKVFPLNTNQEGSLEERRWNSAEVPQGKDFVVKVEMTTLQKRHSTLCQNLDIFSNEGICSWLSSFFQRKDDKVQSPSNENVDVSSIEGFSSQRKDDETDSPTNQHQELVGTDDDKVERDVREQRRDQAIVKLQSLIRGYVARKHYKLLMRDENPPLRTVRYFSRLLDPVDPSFVQQLQLNLLKEKSASNLKTIYKQKEEMISLEKDIVLLIKDKTAQLDLLSRYKKLTSKNNNQIKEAITMGRQAVSESIKNREKLESYKHLFYCLQTDPTYLSRLIGQMSDPQDMTTVVDRLLHSLYNYASRPREEYFFVKLMEATLREEVETRLDAIEDVLYGKSMIVKLIVKFYTHRANYKGLVKALTPAIMEILSITYYLVDFKNITSNQQKIIKKLIEKIHPTTHEFATYNKVHNLVESIFSSVDIIPYGLRYLTKVLQKSLQTKFPEETEEVVLRTVSQFLSQYLQPAIERPDLYGLIAPDVYLGSIQRVNLMRVSRIILQTMQFFPDKTTNDPMLSIFICSTGPSFRKFFHNVLNVPEPEEKFKFYKFFEAVWDPVVKISAEDIIYTHSLLSRYENVVFCDTMDIAYQAFKDIGPVPHVNDLLAMDAAGYDKNNIIKISLFISSKYPLLHNFKTEKENLKIITKKLVLDLIRLVPGETLQDVLMTPISLAQEEQHRTLMGGTPSTRTNDPQDITESYLMKDHDLPLQIKCYKISANLNTLQDACAFSGVRNHQDLLNLIAWEIKEKHKLRLERKSETRTIQQILDILCRKVDDQQNNKDLYKRYWEKCLDNILAHETHPGGQIRFEDDEGITYTAKKLSKKGVIVGTQGEFRQLKNEVLCIKLAGDVFNVSLGSKGVLLPVVDVLRLHNSSNPILNLFHYDVDVGMFLFLVTKRFGKQHNLLRSPSAVPLLQM